MGLLEILISGVGIGVAKGLLKVWFKEEPILAGVGSSLLDIIKSKTSDTAEQRNAEKQLEKVAAKVAQSLKDTISARYPNISDERKVVIANAAGETVNTTEFSAALLVKTNLSPSDLLNVFLEKSGAEGGNPAFSGKGDNPAPSEECDLYSAILSEAAQLIVDGALQYPNYTEAVFSELLQGQDEHVHKMNLILEELKRIREARTGDDSAFDDFDEKYRRAVIRRLDELQLFGVDLASTSKRYKLSTAYVSLLVEREALQSEDIGGVLKEPEEQDEEDTRESVKAEEALAQSSRLFIRGGPGSGKTTLLQWVAVMSAARNLKYELSEWNEYVPFFIRLRAFAAKNLPSPDDFAGLVSEALESPPIDWVRSRLESGRAVVLIDGLDELPADRKDEVRKWVKDLTAEFRGRAVRIEFSPACRERRLA